MAGAVWMATGHTIGPTTSPAYIVQAVRLGRLCLYDGLLCLSTESFGICLVQLQTHSLYTAGQAGCVDAFAAFCTKVHCILILIKQHQMTAEGCIPPCIHMYVQPRSDRPALACICCCWPTLTSAAPAGFARLARYQLPIVLLSAVTRFVVHVKCNLIVPRSACLYADGQGPCCLPSGCITQSGDSSKGSACRHWHVALPTTAAV
jgi:hypothetical protein